MVTQVITFGTESDPAKRLRLRQGAAIRTVRKMRGLTPAELATKIGKTPSAVSQWELGTYTPRQSVQVLIAKTLDVPWSMLFGLDDAA